MKKSKVILYYAHSNKMVYTDEDFLQSDKVVLIMGIFSIVLLLILFLIFKLFV